MINEDPVKHTSRYDAVILTVPLGVARGISMEVSAGKTEALTRLEYDHSCKVYALFDKCWWKGEDAGLDGSTSVTDLCIRKVVYPNTKASTDEPGVICASYTWAKDAQYFESITKKRDFKDQIVKDLSLMHPESADLIKQHCQGIQFRTFSTERFCRGSFAMFGPTQMDQLYPELIKPEMNNRLFFAGEHTDIHHAWIVGALNSAIRSVVQVLQSLGRDEDVIRVLELWPNWQGAEEWSKTKKM